MEASSCAWSKHVMCASPAFLSSSRRSWPGASGHVCQQLGTKQHLSQTPRYVLALLVVMLACCSVAAW